jgi:capsular polysaccharide export protein
MAPTVSIEGPVLLLMGPIGTFFARLAHHLEQRGVPVWKVSFPLHEFGFAAHQRIGYAGGMDNFRSFLLKQINDKGIRHIFMYGDFIDPHRIAIDLIRELNADCQRNVKIEAWVFELGYIRPNFVSLERERVNARSSLNRPTSFYRGLPDVDTLPRRGSTAGLRWRKAWKMPTFILHAFTNYAIINGPHKLQPRPSYLLAQVRGLIRKYKYRLTELPIRRLLFSNTSYFLVPLQVATDSQISLSSDYAGMEPFIEQVIHSFASHADDKDQLIFKHHPRDRGYNNYQRLIRHLAAKHSLKGRVHYFHDAPLGPALKRAKGVVTINSTVGLQALYHRTPTKVMGRTFYNLEGLSDQQPLDTFWADPQAPDRRLFRKFYCHTIETTQINGNFDGSFPFSDILQVAPVLAIAATGPKPDTVQLILRLLTLARGFLTYYLQLLAIAIGARARARRLLERSAQLGLAGMGVRVLIHRRHDVFARPQIHIANHGHPLDVLLVQGYFRERSMTTAARHLRYLLPWFRLSAENYGHLHLDHTCPASRLEGLRRLMRLLGQRGRLFLFPSGSLVTPITERVSGSVYLLARRHKAMIIPWVTHYRGFPPREKALQYKPFKLMLARLLGPQATIFCEQGEAIDIRSCRDEHALINRIQNHYRRADVRRVNQRMLPSDPA